MYRGRTITLGFPPFTHAVKWLVAINAGIYLLMALLGVIDPRAAVTLTYYFGLVPQLVVHGFLWQVVSYSFLHGGIFHILFNMLMLWMFGSQFEMDWGRRQFLEYYFFCVVGAAIVTILVSFTGALGLSPVQVTVGASGGIYGLLLAFGMIYGDREMFIFPLPFLIKAKYMVAILIFVAIASALQGPSGIASMAHLGGLLFGFIYIKWLPMRGLAPWLSERYFSARNSYYRWKRRRAARKFEVYMRQHDRPMRFDEHGNYIPPEEQDDDRRGPWVN